MSVRCPTESVPANEGLSILDLILALASEWKIFAACLAAGVLFAALVHARFEPTYSSHFIARIGSTYGSGSPQPLENPFLVAKRIVLRFGGVSNEDIRARTYEQDFDFNKRMTIEIDVETRSSERTLALANEIAGFLRSEHAKLYSDELERNTLARSANESSAATNRRLSDSYKKMQIEGRKKRHGDHHDPIARTLDEEFIQWAILMQRQYDLLTNNLLATSGNYRVFPTIFTLVPERTAIVASVFNQRVYLSGILGGLFFGMIIAALVQRHRQSCQGRETEGEKAERS